MMSMKKRMIAGLMSLLLLWGSAYAQTGKQAPAYPPSVPKPTLAEARYGEHERHVLDFWKAPSNTPTPLVFVIHGGAWVTGSKKQVSRKAFSMVCALFPPRQGLRCEGRTAS